jgi:hypothetical protein
LARLSENHPLARSDRRDPYGSQRE